MFENVRWEPHERLVSLGRNGTGRCTGIELFHNDGVVSHQPITSKNQLARCEITMPMSAVPSLIAALKTISIQSTQLRKQPSHKENS
jgi:hypothetical protein